MQGGSGHPDPDERSWGENRIGVWKKTADLECSGGDIELVVNEIDCPLMRKAIFILQLQVNRHRSGSDIGQFSFPDLFLVVEYGPFIHIEIGIDRMHADNVGELAWYPA